MAAAHGAVEVLAEQWEIRNIAYAILLKSRSFPVSATQTTTTASSQSAVGPPQGLADNARKSGRRPTRGTASAPSDVQADVMLHETLPLSNTRTIRRCKALNPTADSLLGLGLWRLLRIVESDESRDREDRMSELRVTKDRLTKTLISTGQASDSVHDPASSLRNEARPRKRRCMPAEQDTEALREY